MHHPRRKGSILSSAHFCLRTRNGRLYGPRGLQSTLSRKQAADVEDNPMLLTVSIDHARVKYLDQYRVTSPVFNVFLPQSNVVGIPAGTIGPVVSDGYWLLLTPAKGRIPSISKAKPLKG